MYMIISTLIFFLIIIYSSLLYFKLKQENLEKLKKGICPNCDGNYSRIKDGKIISSVSSKKLRNGGCSGTDEIEYKCDNCGFKEIHSEPSSCGI